MTVPQPTVDRFTQLGEYGYGHDTLEEREAAFFKDLSGLNTVGELLRRALDPEMARDILGITDTGMGVVPIPNGLNTTGTPTADTALFGDGSWKEVDVSSVVVTKESIGLGNVDNTSDVNKPVSTDQAASIATKATTASVTALSDLVTALTAVVDAQAVTIAAMQLEMESFASSSEIGTQIQAALGSYVDLTTYNGDKAHLPYYLYYDGVAWPAAKPTDVAAGQPVTLVGGPGTTPPGWVDSGNNDAWELNPDDIVIP